MTEHNSDDVTLSRRIVVGMILILLVLLGSLTYGALRDFTPPG